MAGDKKVTLGQKLTPEQKNPHPAPIEVTSPNHPSNNGKWDSVVNNLGYAGKVFGPFK